MAYHMENGGTFLARLSQSEQVKKWIEELTCLTPFSDIELGKIPLTLRFL